MNTRVRFEKQDESAGRHDVRHFTGCPQRAPQHSCRAEHKAQNTRHRAVHGLKDHRAAFGLKGQALAAGALDFAAHGARHGHERAGHGLQAIGLQLAARAKACDLKTVGRAEQRQLQSIDRGGVALQRLARAIRQLVRNQGSRRTCHSGSLLKDSIDTRTPSACSTCARWRTSTCKTGTTP